MSAESAGALEGMTSMPASRLAGLYEEHVGRAVALATLLTGDRAIAEDIAHDAFLRVAGRFRDLRDPGAFGPYLRTTVVNMCRARARRLDRERILLRIADPIGCDRSRHAGGGPRPGVGLHRGVALSTASRARPAVLGRPVRGRDRSGSAVLSQGGERPVVTCTGNASRWHRKERGMNDMDERIAEALQRHGAGVPRNRCRRARSRACGDARCSSPSGRSRCRARGGRCGRRAVRFPARLAGRIAGDGPAAERLPAPTARQRRRCERRGRGAHDASGSRTATPHPTTRTARCPTPSRSTAKRCTSPPRRTRWRSGT